jgi:hypothetical protein
MPRASWPSAKAVLGSEATPLIAVGASGDGMQRQRSHIMPLEVVASVTLQSARRLRRRTTLFASSKVVQKTMGAWGSFLFLSNLITGA